MKDFDDFLEQVKKHLSPDELEEIMLKAQAETARMLHIKAKDWQDSHPVYLSCGSDAYYSKLVNRLIDKILDNYMPNPPRGVQVLIALSTAAYLEDMVNDFGVWRAFRNLYRKAHGSWLPFYDTDHPDYMLDNVNVEDLQFIIWQCMCRCGQPEGRTFSPYSPGFKIMAEQLFNEIVDEFEHAPESKRIADYISNWLKSGELFKLKYIADWLVGNCPLTSVPDKAMEIADYSNNLIEKGMPEEIAVYSTLAGMAWTDCTGALGVKANVWIAQMCRDRGLDSVAEKLDELKQRQPEPYEIVESNHKYVVLRDRYGSEYHMLKDHKMYDKEAVEMGALVSGLVYFDGDWNQYGVAMPLDLQSWKKFKNEQHETTEFLPQMQKLVDEAIEAHGGQQVFVCKSVADIDKILGKDLRPIGINDGNTYEPENFGLLLSHEGAPVILEDAASFLKVKGNRKFSKKKSAKEGLALIFRGIPDDVAKYIQDNDIAPEVQIYTSQGGDLGKELVQKNLRFLCGFYRTKEADYEEDEDDYSDDKDFYDDYDGDPDDMFRGL